MAGSWGDAHFNLFLRGGSVFYLQERSLTSPLPHFFVVLNHDPRSDACLLLVVSSSQIESVKRRRSSLPAETLVEIGADEYRDFTKDSIIDCNNVFHRTKAELQELMNSGGTHKADIPRELLEKMRAGVLASPVIENETKDSLTRDVS